MSRPSKIEVAAINIRIPADKKRDYSALIDEIFKSKRPVKIRGDSFLAITNFDHETKSGSFSKYFNIDIDGDWFDIENFGPAAPEKVGEISIPETLRPNLSSFNFILNEDLHIICFEMYSDSKYLSPNSVEKYFREILRDKNIHENFGRVEADIVKSFGEVDRILSLPYLRELFITIRRPNPDDISGDLASMIEESLREQNAEEYVEIIKSKNEDGLIPNGRTRKLANIGADNGFVSAKSIVNGVVVPHSTNEVPEKEVDTFNKEEVSGIVISKRLAGRIANTIRGRRAIM